MAKKGLVTIYLLLVLISAQGQNIFKVYEKAEDLFYTEMHAEALAAYERVLFEDPSFEDAAYKAELCRLLTTEREKPLDQLFELRTLQGKDDKFYNYWLGLIYVKKYQFEEAIATWKTFLRSKSQKSATIKDETKDYIRMARDYVKFFEDTDNYEIHRLEGEINSASAELTPAYFDEKDELLFASSRASSGGEEQFKIYHSIKQDDGWTHISEVPVLGEFSRSAANLEVVSSDGKLFIFKEDKKGGGLFFSETTNGKWVIPVEFDSKIGHKHIKSHFFINEHEDRIIFASDKNAKSFGLDLFQTFRDAETGKWSKPAPFAEVINSEFDEDSPYLSPDEKTLYFSSKGHGSIGGYDVFKTTFDSVNLTWSEPVNLGFPINSPDDELHFKIDEKEETGYFSSNRLHSLGDFDIYFFWEIEMIKIEGRVYDLATKSALENATVRFTPSQYTDEHFKSSVSEKGKYATEIISDETYLVEVIQDGQTVFTDEFEIHETGGQKTVYIKDFLLNNDGSMIARSGRQGGNNTTTATKNQTTNAARTASTTTQPANKTSTALARNTQPAQKKQQTKRSASQPSARTTTRSSGNTSRNVANLANYNTGGKVIIHNVYFDFGTSGLSRNANPVLEELFQVLKQNNRLKVEIGGHTDNVGSPEANMWMSENRAKVVRKWLIDRGIESNRLVAKGYGASNPLASNDDEIGGRELNRRIEVLVIR